MSNYVITFARSARKELETLDAKIVNRLSPKLKIYLLILVRQVVAN